MENIKIGVIGGTGLYEIEGLSNKQELEVDTPFGKPSDKIMVGELENKKVAFLPRHGKGHRILPTEVPQRANIYALKSLGVEQVISVSAVGSLKKEIEPRHIVFPDQLIDKTKSRVNTFYGNGIVVHVAFAYPFCDRLRKLFKESAEEVGCTYHYDGTYVCMEGPLFSTKAESELHRSWGASLIGMTALPEAKLAREAEMCYATIALATDYDCWLEEEEVNAHAVMETLKINSETAKAIIKKLLPKLDESEDCECKNSLATSILTAKDNVPDDTYNKVKLMVGRYMS